MHREMPPDDIYLQDEIPQADLASNAVSDSTADSRKTGFDLAAEVSAC